MSIVPSVIASEPQGSGAAGAFAKDGFLGIDSSAGKRGAHWGTHVPLPHRMEVLMHGIPADFDAAMFEGTTLERVTFAENLIFLAFEDELHLTVYGSLSYRLDGSSEEIEQEAPVVATTLPGLIGKDVVRGELARGEEIRISFPGGGAIALRDSLAHYESFIVAIEGREIVV